ncbi:MAG: phage tail assembly chaperone [Novosphingobium sp.]
MNPHFGAAAVKLCGIAARLLGWRPADFWAATPAELITALTPAETSPAAGIDRTDLDRLMEDDNARTQR